MTADQLKDEIERRLPEFAAACRGNEDFVLLHQDAFAADYQEHEFTLLGQAIKYEGLHRKEVRIVSRNRETLPKVQ